MTPFNAVAAVLSYLRARGAAPEEDVLRALQAHEEEHAERAREERMPAPKPLAALRLLADLERAGRIVRDGAVCIFPKRPAA